VEICDSNALSSLRFSRRLRLHCRLRRRPIHVHLLGRMGLLAKPSRSSLGCRSVTSSLLLEILGEVFLVPAGRRCSNLRTQPRRRSRSTLIRLIATLSRLFLPVFYPSLMGGR